jgi:hypothetical protein
VNIPINKLLAKIEEELKLAKSGMKEESLREKVYSIKILCELILDEKSVKSGVSVNQVSTIQPVIAQPVLQQPSSNQQVFQQPTSFQQPKKLEMEDEANGDSLLDF